MVAITSLLLAVFVTQCLGTRPVIHPNDSALKGCRTDADCPSRAVCKKADFFVPQDYCQCPEGMRLVKDGVNQYSCGPRPGWCQNSWGCPSWNSVCCRTDSSCFVMDGGEPWQECVASADACKAKQDGQCKGTPKVVP
jgi:hypothetical protein